MLIYLNDNTKYKNKGLTGLTNLGNTCFINSCIQILSHSYEINNFLDKGNYKHMLKSKQESVLLLEWDDLRKLMWSKNCIISPGKFIKSIQEVARRTNRDIFTGFSQNDLPEFFIFLIDSFHIALSREVKITIKGNIENEEDKLATKCFKMVQNMYSKDYSEMYELFYGTHISRLTYVDSKETSSTPEPFMLLNLPIPTDNKSPNLFDCLDLYTQEEHLTGINGVYNEKTKNKEDAIKSIKFWSLPKILTIDLKRFNQRNQKDQRLIDFPLEGLNLSRYVIGYNKDNSIYDLYGIANHSGGVHGGHYTCFIKNANNKWYLFNDTNIAEVKNPQELITPKAYCFFYRKRI